MHTRIDAETRRLSRARFVVAHPQGEHHFRVPIASRVARAVDFHTERPGSATTRWIEQAALLVGMCWDHDVLELDALYPADPTGEALAVYAEAVQLELQEEGYASSDIMRFGAEINRQLTRKADEERAALAEAQALAGFSGPRPDSAST